MFFVSKLIIVPPNIFLQNILSEKVVTFAN